MRDLKEKIKQIRHCNIIPSDCRNGCFQIKRKWFSMKRKLFPNGNGSMDAMEQLPQPKNVQKIQNHKPFQSFGNTGSRSRSQTEVSLHKRSDTMFGYTGYSQKDEHLEQPLPQIDHRSTHRFFDVVKTLERETVHGPNQIDTWSNLLCKRKKVTNELLIIDQLAKDPPCSLNSDHGPIRC